VTGNLEFEKKLETDRVHALLGGDWQYDSGSGQYFHRLHKEMAELIARVYPNLRLAWIPPSDRAPGELYPFALIQINGDGSQSVICNCREDELPVLLERIFEMDTTRQDVLASLDRHNAKLQADIDFARKDKMNEVHDQAYHILKGKNYYKHNGRTFS